MTLISCLKMASDSTSDKGWALSTLALTALENIVNIKLKELEEDVRGRSQERASRLKEALVRKVGMKGKLAT